MKNTHSILPTSDVNALISHAEDIAPTKVPMPSPPININKTRDLNDRTHLLHRQNCHNHVKYSSHIASLSCHQTRKLRCKQMEIFHHCFRYTPSNLSDFVECSLLLQFMLHLEVSCLKMKSLIDIYALYYAEFKCRLEYTF